MFEPKKFEKPSWSGNVTRRIDGLETTDHDADGLKDIKVSTSRGPIYLDFDGRLFGPHETGRFSLIRPQ